MPNTTNRVKLPYILQSQSQKEVTHNASLDLLDALLQAAMVSIGVNTPPGSPLAGDSYIVGTSPTGAWAGQVGNIAFYDSGWKFVTAREGLALWVNDEDVLYIYDGATWQSQAIAVYATLSGTAHTLDGSYVGKTILTTNASAVTLTLPNSLYAGFQCRVIQYGAGQVTFTPASGANRRNRQSHTKAAGQYAVCALEVVANAGGAAAEYILSGDTAV